MRQLARSAWRLGPAERLLALEALCAAPAAALAVRVLAPHRAARLFQSALGRRRQSSVAPERIASIADAVLGLARCRCLTKALVVHRMLARRGVASDIVIGVAVDGGGMRAHAWVEHGGDILIGRGARAHSPLWRVRADVAPRGARA